MDEISQDEAAMIKPPFQPRIIIINVPHTYLSVVSTYLI